MGTVKQKGLEWDCVQVQHTIFRFLCHPMGVWCSRTSLAWDSYSYTRLVPSRYLIVFWDERRLGIRLRRARGVIPKKQLNSDWVRVCSYTSLNQFWEKNWLLCSLLYPLPPPPQKKMNKRYCVPSNKSQPHFQNNSSKWKHDWTCLGNNGFLTLTVTWDVQNVKKVFYFRKKKKQISRLHIHHMLQQT